jgi:HAD superfamily hydrolase (TIGR01509 family)
MRDFFSRYDVIFFDIGATLIEGPAETPARFLARRLGWDDPVRRRFDRYVLTHELPDPAALASWLNEAFGLSPDRAVKEAALVWQSQIEGPRPVAGAQACLAGVRAQGYRFGFISNIWHPYAASFVRLFGSLAESSLSFFSFREGVAKPDLALYARALAAAGCPADRVVMVGDSYETDIAPAQAMGMGTVWLLHRPEKEAFWLEEIRAGRLKAPDLIVDSIGKIDF